MKCFQLTENPAAWLRISASMVDYSMYYIYVCVFCTMYTVQGTPNEKDSIEGEGVCLCVSVCYMVSITFKWLVSIGILSMLQFYVLFAARVSTLIIIKALCISEWDLQMSAQISIHSIRKWWERIRIRIRICRRSIYSKSSGHRGIITCYNFA